MAGRNATVRVGQHHVCLYIAGIDGFLRVGLHHFCQTFLHGTGPDHHEQFGAILDAVDRYVRGITPVGCITSTTPLATLATLATLLTPVHVSEQFVFGGAYWTFWTF